MNKILVLQVLPLAWTRVAGLDLSTIIVNEPQGDEEAGKVDRKLLCEGGVCVRVSGGSAAGPQSRKSSGFAGG